LGSKTAEWEQKKLSGSKIADPEVKLLIKEQETLSGSITADRKEKRLSVNGTANPRVKQLIGIRKSYREVKQLIGK